MRAFSKKILAGLVFASCLLIAACGILSGTTSTNGIFGLPSSNANAISQPTQIALLVPLQGPLGATGQAIRNGFLAAYYYAKQQQSNSPKINVIDTSRGDIVAIYKQAVDEGADFIVGPLTKPDVRAITSMGKLPVTTLALNTLDDQQKNVTNLYQFGLSPLDEAAQAAEKAFQDGHRQALVITPAGEWGQGIAQEFAQTWQNLGGTVVGNYAYANQNDYSAGIRNLLQVTESRPAHPSAMTGTKAVPHHRQDADVIFLAAFPQQARLIRPILLFYNAGDLSVYATSLIYNGVPSPQYDNDLNGVMFDDMPWILNSNASQRLNDIHTRIVSIWGNSFDQYPRLYALGIDAYMLTADLGKLAAGGNVPGATGELYLNQYNHITRRLSWTQIRNGSAVPLQ